MPTPGWGWPFGDPYAAPSFKIVSDHRRKILSVSGFLGNNGPAALDRNIQVALGITYRRAGQLISTQRASSIGNGLRAGELLETPPTRAQLVYFNDDNGAKYVFELLVDYGYDVVDFFRQNNYQSYTWWAVDPSELNRIEDGGSIVFTNGQMGVEDVPETDKAE